MTNTIAYARRLAIGVLYYGLRPLDRVLPPPVLLALTAPFLAVATALQLALMRPVLAKVDRMPASVSGPRRGPMAWPYHWRQRLRMNLANVSVLWADRLGTARWSRLLRREGSKAAWDLLESRTRPVILLTFHFGPGRVPFYWLRACGVPVAALAMGIRFPFGPRVMQLADQAHGLEGVQKVFKPEMAREAAEFLQKNRALIVFATGGYGRHVEAEADGVRLPLSAGPFRLAAIVDAAVIPCVFSAESGGSTTITLGDPLPQAVVTDRKAYPEACSQLFRFYLAKLRGRTGQADYWLLHRLSATAPKGAAPARPFEGLDSSRALLGLVP